MLGLCQCGGRDLGDVFHVDKWFGDVTDGQSQFALQNGIEKVRFAEVLAEPAGTQDGPVDATVLYHAFCLLRFKLTATRQQHQFADTAIYSLGRERLDRFQGAGHREVRLKGDVRGLNALKGSRPGRTVFPVKGRGGATGA